MAKRQSLDLLTVIDRSKLTKEDLLTLELGERFAVFSKGRVMLQTGLGGGLHVGVSVHHPKEYLGIENNDGSLQVHFLHYLAAMGRFHDVSYLSRDARFRRLFSSHPPGDVGFSIGGEGVPNNTNAFSLANSAILGLSSLEPPALWYLGFWEQEQVEDNFRQLTSYSVRINTVVDDIVQKYLKAEREAREAQQKALMEKYKL